MNQTKSQENAASGRATASPAAKKSYRTPTLRRLGDFHTMTRTGDRIPLQNDTIIGDFYIS